MTEECEFCKEDLSKSNPKFVLRELTSVGYTELDFCRKDCIVGYIVKKFRRKITKIIANKNI